MKFFARATSKSPAEKASKGKLHNSWQVVRLWQVVKSDLFWVVFPSLLLVTMGVMIVLAPRIVAFVIAVLFVALGGLVYFVGVRVVRLKKRVESLAKTLEAQLQVNGIALHGVAVQGSVMRKGFEIDDDEDGHGDADLEEHGSEEGALDADAPEVDAKTTPKPSEPSAAKKVEKEATNEKNSAHPSPGIVEKGEETMVDDEGKKILLH